MSNERSVHVSGDCNQKIKSRKALRRAVFAGIVRRHRNILSTFGSFLGLYRQDRENTYGASK